MTRDEYIEDIKISLGAPVVDVEIESLLGKLVDKAFREVKRFIVDTCFVTLPYSSTGIDVRKYKIESVIQIFRTSNPARTSNITEVYTLSNIGLGNTNQVNLLLSDYLYRTQMTQLKNTISTDLDFTFDKEAQVLYINAVYPKPQYVTLAYSPELKDVSEVKEQYWENYIQRLSLAFAKETLGRVRGKYDLSSSLYKLDGPQLLSEGISERDAVRQELEENSDLAFPID